jgi:hypothetical protein
MKNDILILLAVFMIIIAGCTNNDTNTETNNNEQVRGPNNNQLNTNDASAPPDQAKVAGDNETPRHNPPASQNDTSLRQRPEGMAAPEIDYDSAAQKLGITTDELKNALGSEGMPNFKEAANNLGVSEEELRQALGFQEPGNMPDRNLSRTP